MKRVAFRACLASALLLAPLLAACKKDAAESVVVENGKASVVADARGFTPSHLTVKPGTPIALTFTRTSDDTCAKEVVFPDLKTKTELPLNTPVTVEVPAGPARTLGFQCGMGMFRGALVVK